MAQPTAVKLDYIGSLLAEFDYILSMKWQECKMVDCFKIEKAGAELGQAQIKLGLRSIVLFK